MDYSKISDYFKYPAKIAELRQRLYQILIDKGVEVSANESLNSMIEKVKSIEGINPTDTLYILENGVYDVTEYGTAEVNVQAVAPENDLDFLVDNTISQFTMPSRISEIGAYKFYKCYNLSQVSIANGTTIPSYAFYECVNLESMVMPNCTYIGEYAFYNCKKMSVATMPSAYSIGTYAFYGCNLESYSNSQAYQLFASTFYNNLTLSEVSLTNVYMLNSGNNFYNCKNLTSINMSNLMFAYGSGNFETLPNLKSYNFPNLVNAQGVFAKNNSFISELKLSTLSYINVLRSSSTVSISYFIDNCRNLASVNLSTLMSVTGGGVVANLSLISELKLPLLRSITVSPGGSFQNFIYNLANLTTLEMPALETVWNYDGSYAFIRNCPNLENLNVQHLHSIPNRFISGTKISDFICLICSSVGYTAITSNSHLITATIPNVNTIYSSGFYKNSNLQNVYDIELTTLGSYAFYDCEELSELHFTSAYISAFALANCTKLSKLYINTYSQQDVISANAFVNTPITNSMLLNEYGKIYVHPDKLAYFQSKYSAYSFSSRFASFEESYSNETIVAYRYYNSNLTQIPSELSMAKNIYRNALQGNAQMSGELNMPLVENIGTYAFYGMSKITLNNIDNLKFVGVSAFQNCSSISEINAPNLKWVMSSAFYSCKSITSITAPNLQCVGSTAFYGCYNLNTLNAENLEYVAYGGFQDNAITNINLPNCKYLASYAFGKNYSNMSSTQRISMPKLEFAGDYAFYNNTSLTTAYLPNCRFISSNTFAYNKYLSDLNIDNCYYIGTYAFYQCSSLPYLSNLNIRYIEANAFGYCSRLSYLYLPECRYIGNSAFVSCSAISELYIPNIKYIGDNAFAYNNSITSFIISKNISLGTSVFLGCGNLSIASIPFFQKIPIGIFRQNISLQSVIMESASEIGNQAFYQCSILSDLRISNIISIGEGAFYGCNNLNFNSLNLESCLYIGPYAFTSCYNLSRFENNHISIIYPYTFSGCSNISEIITPYVSSIATYAFANCFNLTSIYLQYSLLTIIPNGAFSGCSQLQFPEDSEIFAQVSRVEANAFYNCTNLSKIVGNNISRVYSSTYANAGILEINNSTILTIENYAFNGCKSLKSISLENCSIINAYAFQDCTSLSYINIPNIFDLGMGVFANTGISSIPETLATNLTLLPSATFSKCLSLTDATLLNCSIIGYYAFTRCENLVTVSASKTLTISEGAFRSCYSLETVYAPEVSSIGAYAFKDCYALKSAIFPNAITSVWNYSTFENCSNLKTVHLGKTLSVGDYQFRGCINLEEVILPECLTVSSSAFYGCSNITTLVMPKCTNISANAFAGNSKLTSINLPRIMVLSQYAFANCTSLTYANLEYVKDIGPYAFSNCTDLAEISAIGIAGVGANTFQGCKNLKSIMYAGNRFTTYTFSDCNSLESVYILNAHQLGDVCGSSRLSYTFYNTPILNSSYLGYYGKIYVPSNRLSLCRNYYGNAYSDRFEEIPYSIASKYIFASQYHNSAINLSEVNLNANYILSLAFSTANILDSASYSELTLSNCQYIGNSAFYSCSTLPSIINLPQVSIINSLAFCNCSTITSIRLDVVSDVEAHAFANCTNLSSLYAPNLKNFSYYTFNNCGFTELNISGSDLTFSEGAFRNCSKLTSINITGTIKSFNFYAFKNIGSVTYYNVPSCPPFHAQESMFALSTNVDYINLGGCSYLYSYTLYRTEPTFINTLILPDVINIQNYNCFYNLTINNLSLPKISYIQYQYMFSGLTIEALKLPQVTNITQSYAMANINAKYMAFKQLSYIGGSSMFSNCTRLEKLVLNVSSMVRTYSCYNMFNNTPIANSTYLGYYGSIYVPASLLADFAMTSFWSGWTNRMTTIEEHEQELRDLGLLD